MGCCFLIVYKIGFGNKMAFKSYLTSGRYSWFKKRMKNSLPNRLVLLHLWLPLHPSFSPPPIALQPLFPDCCTNIFLEVVASEVRTAGKQGSRSMFLRQCVPSNIHKIADSDIQSEVPVELYIYICMYLYSNSNSMRSNILFALSFLLKGDFHTSGVFLSLWHFYHIAYVLDRAG